MEKLAIRAAHHHLRILNGGDLVVNGCTRIHYGCASRFASLRHLSRA
jgi:hypothetical protein